MFLVWYTTWNPLHLHSYSHKSRHVLNLWSLIFYNSMGEIRVSSKFVYNVNEKVKINNKNQITNSQPAWFLKSLQVRVKLIIKHFLYKHRYNDYNQASWYRQPFSRHILYKNTQFNVCYISTLAWSQTWRYDITWR